MLHTRTTSMNWTGGTRNWFANSSRDDMRRLRSTLQPQRRLVLEDVLSEDVTTVDVHAAASEPDSSQTDLASLTRVLSRFCCSPTFVTQLISYLHNPAVYLTIYSAECGTIYFLISSFFCSIFHWTLHLLYAQILSKVFLFNSAYEFCLFFSLRDT